MEDGAIPRIRATAGERAVVLRLSGWRFATLLFGVALALALVLYAPTLGNSWAYDDIDYINQAADVLAGEKGFWETLFRPQGEHIVAGFRLVLFASLELFGIEAMPFRLLVLCAHAASGAFLGLLAAASTRSRAAGLTTAAVYVGASGFSSMWIWFPSGATVPFASALFTGATLLVARGGGRSALARALAAAAVVVALLTESTLAPLVLVPIVVDELERRRRGARRWSLGAFTVFSMAAAVTIAVSASLLYRATFGPRVDVSLVHGVPRAAFLLLCAPFRLFFPGVPILASEPGASTAFLGSILGLAIAGLGGAVLVALWRHRVPSLGVIAALVAFGPAGWVGLVGLGRWRSSYWDLYEADRYFFPLLIPLSLVAGAAAASVSERLRFWPRRARLALLACLLVAAAGELALHRRAMLRRVPFDIYQSHEERFRQLELLAARLENAARVLPTGNALAFPDTPLWFPDVHNGYLSSRLLAHVLVDGAGGRLVVRDTVGARDAAILNPLLARWADDIGAELPYLAVAADGRLVDHHVIRYVDFSTGPHDGAVVRGFYAWEGALRWMRARGELRLTLACTAVDVVLAAPMDALQVAGIHEIAVRVSAVDEATGFRAELGTIPVLRPGPQGYRLDAGPFNRRVGNGRTIQLVLEADRTWRPADTLPGSADTRELSVMVLAAGCGSA